MAASSFDYTYTNGLVSGHAYSLIGTHTLSNGVRLVKLVNPHGVDKYTGDWSDSSSKFTEQLHGKCSSG